MSGLYVRAACMLAVGPPRAGQRRRFSHGRNTDHQTRIQLIGRSSETGVAVAMSRTLCVGEPPRPWGARCATMCQCGYFERIGPAGCGIP